MEADKSFMLGNGQIPLTLSPIFTLPEEKRPFLSQVENLAVPIIDLKDENNHHEIVKNISKACEEYGFFQIINHGIDDRLCQDMINAVFSFFNLPPEERSALYSDDLTKLEVKMKQSTCGVKLLAILGIIEMAISPSSCRKILLNTEHIGVYAKEIGGLTARLLSLISEGLGLNKDCLKAQIGDNPTLRSQANYYPPCPEPELTLGLAPHTDLSALTILLQSQDICGLHVIKDDHWVAVNPAPNALVINLGDQIQVLSNGRFRSVHHRAVSNKDRPRASLAMFYGPNNDTVIGPIKELIDDKHPPIYRSYRFAEFFDEFKRQEGTRRMVKEAFELQH